MSIRYFSKWLQDEEKSFADWRNVWAWLDLNVTDPPPGVIYLHPRPIVLGENAETTEHPLLLGRGGEHLQLADSSDGAIGVDGGSASFIVRRSTLYIFNYTPLVILVLGIITNSIQLALCCRLRHKLPAVAFIAAIAAADLVCIVLGAGRMAVDRLFSTSLDHLHPWSCKMRHFFLASALDLSVWLVPLGLCELWRPASRIIIYAIVTSLLLNLHNLVTKGWQVQGDFGQEPVMNDCGYSFPDARIFWLHVHPIVSVIINVIGPALTSMLLVLTLSFQGRCHPVAVSTKVDNSYSHHERPHSASQRKKQPQKQMRINLLVLFAVLAAMQAILLAPTAVLSAMELFMNTTVHPSMRALVFFSQLFNCVIKLPLIFLAAPQLCPAMSESSMGLYGEKKQDDKKKKKTKKKSSKHGHNQEPSESDGDISDLENEDHNSLVAPSSVTHPHHSKKNGGQGHNKEQARKAPAAVGATSGKSAKGGRSSSNNKHRKSGGGSGREKKYEEMIAAMETENEAMMIDAGKQLAMATSTMSRRPPPPPSLSLLSTEQHYYTNTRPQHQATMAMMSQNHHLFQQQQHQHQHQHQQQQPHFQQQQQQRPNLSMQLQLQQQQMQTIGTLPSSASHRHASLVTSGGGFVAPSSASAAASSTLPMPQPPPQLLWLNEKSGGSGGGGDNRKIYV